MKPSFGAASAGVIKIETLNDLYTQYNHTIQNIHTREDIVGGYDLFVEEYIVWDEIDCDIIVQEWVIKFISITDNVVWMEPYFMEIGESAPSILSHSIQQSIFDIVQRTITSFNIKNVCMHYEFKISPSWPIPLEINLRMWWGAVYYIIKSIWDVNLPIAAACVALGTDIDKIDATNPHEYCISRYLMPPQSGKLTKFEIPQRVYDSPEVIDMYIGKKVWDISLLPPDGYENFDLWRIVIACDTSQKASSLMDKIMDDIIIETI